MIILLGKHQFTVSSIDDSGLDSMPSTPHGAASHQKPQQSVVETGSSQRRSSFNSQAIMSLVENAEKIIAGISMHTIEESKSGNRGTEELSSR